MGFRTRTVFAVSAVFCVAVFGVAGPVFSADASLGGSREADLPSPFRMDGGTSDSGESSGNAQDQAPDRKEDGQRDDENSVRRGFLLGDWLRGENGLSFEAVYTADALDVARGGFNNRNAMTYRGNLDLLCKADLDKMQFGPGGKVGLVGGCGHGEGPTRLYLGDYQWVSSIDWTDFAQVSEYWYERAFFEDFVTIRIGKQNCSAWFANVDLGVDFLNSSFGVPANIPMPAFVYPSAGAATSFKLSDHVGFCCGVWDGEPDGRNWGFSNTGSTFSIAEVRLKYSLSEREELPGNCHLGIWYHVGVWEDIRRMPSSGSFDGRATASSVLRTSSFSGFGLQTDPLAVASAMPSGNTSGHTFGNNHGVYLGFDQMVFKEVGSDAKDEQGLGVFGQWAWAPDDRNPATQYIGGGVLYRGLIPSRDLDHVGVGVAHVVFSNELDTAGDETAVELFYLARLSRWMMLEPDLQYVFNPGGSDRYAIVAGARFEVVF
jgi:porin